MYLLDTNVLSELRKSSSGRADSNVVRWIDAVPADALHVSVMTMFELELGVLRAERTDPAKGRVLRSWLDDDVKPAFGSRMLPIGGDVVAFAASLHVRDPLNLADSMIAATAHVAGLTVVTRNTNDFERGGVATINPWDPAESA